MGTAAVDRLDDQIARLQRARDVAAITDLGRADTPDALADFLTGWARRAHAPDLLVGSLDRWARQNYWSADPEVSWTARWQYRRWGRRRGVEMRVKVKADHGGMRRTFDAETLPVTV